jgi:hypothetical protein
MLRAFGKMISCCTKPNPLVHAERTAAVRDQECVVYGTPSQNHLIRIFLTANVPALRRTRGMPHFVTLIRYTQQGIAKIKESPARLDAAKKPPRRREEKFTLGT